MDIDLGYLLLVTFVFSTLLILAQRIVVRHRQRFQLFIWLMAILFLFARQFNATLLLSYGLSIVMSWLFWLLIGRYNPVENDDETGIRVLGMDD